MQMIYKILTPNAWDDMCERGVLTPSGVDAADGFVHFSTAAQVHETLDKHYDGHGDLVVLAVNADQCGDDLKWEASRGGALFPHLYGVLTHEPIAGEFALSSGRNGFDAWLSQNAGGHDEPVS